MCVKHFINVLITSTLLCFILSEDSISWDKYTRYILSNSHTTLRHIDDSLLLACSFVWKGAANYTIGCEDSIGNMRDLGKQTPLGPGRDFIIEELNEKSCDYQPCVRIQIFSWGTLFCLDASELFQDHPAFILCDSTNENPKWTITAIDDRGEHAHFLNKATSTAYEAPLLFNNEELETSGEYTMPAAFLIQTTPTRSEASSLLSMGKSGMLGNQVKSASIMYVTNQMTQSAATYPSPNVHPTTKDQTFRNSHIDSTTTHSTVSKTTTGSISSTMPVLRNLNQAKLFTNPTGNKNSKLNNSKKSTTISSFVLINDAILKNQKEYVFPTSSTSMYATTSYLTKDEAKTPSIRTIMRIPKSGKVSAVGNQDDTEATSMAVNGKNSSSASTAQIIAEAGSLNLNPMPETHQIVSKFMNMSGSMWVVGTSMTSAVLTLCMMPKLFINQIQCGLDIMLGLSHVIIMFFVFWVDNQLMCKLTATSLIILLSIYASLAMLECICVYLSLTNTLNSWNTRLFRYISCIFIICFTVGILTYLICFSNDLLSDYSCWINYNNHVSKSTLTVAGILFSMSMIFIETGISDMQKSLPTMQKEERKVCEISSATLVIRVILSTASYILTSYAVFSQNFALFPASFGINVAFGWFNFFAHAICNKKVNGILVKVYSHIKTNLMEIQ